MSHASALRRLISAVCLVLAAASLAAAGSIVDPALRFRTIDTDHFTIYFHQGADRLAARLGDIAEDAWRDVQRPPGAIWDDVPRRTHVVLVDQNESANGWATPFPYNTIVISTAWPSGFELIGNTDDWIRLVFVHEFTHILHLDRSKGWARLVRGVFGRVPIAFPNLFLPGWQVEGIATYEESARTGAGRLTAGNFRALSRDVGDQGLTIDRANGGLTSWPGGLAPYSEGAGFHAYLAMRFGEARLTELAQATSGRVPFTASRVFPRIFGASLGELWTAYRVAETAAPADRPSDGAVRVTRHGYTVLGPRFSTPCEGCPQDIVYSLRTPHAFPSLNAVAPDGTALRTLTTRFLGATSAPAQDVVIFDQQEISRNVGLYSDLHELDRRSGKVRRLTRGARLLDPDLSPDGRTIVSVREGLGHRALVLVPRADPSAPRELVSEPDTQFNAPRWSPDGRRIAVERHRMGEVPSVVVVDAETGRVQVVAAEGSMRIVTPTWRPDGRALVVAGARGTDVFNLYEVPIDDGAEWRRLTFTVAGATWPDVSQNGTTIAFSGYTPDGFDVFTLPYPEAPLTPTRALASALPIDTSRSSAPAGPGPTSRAYSPWRTLRPTFWSPILTAGSDQFRLGVSTSGVDVLGYHAYGVSASWLARSSGWSGSPERIDRRTPDWSAAYAYSRWQPALVGSASRRTSFFNVPGAAGSPARTVGVIERRLEGGVRFPVRRVRYAHEGLVSIVRAVDEYTLPARSVNRSALRGGWAVNSSRRYGFSISAEDGVAIGLTTELTRKAFGAIGNATTTVFDGRAYLPGLSEHHVLAVRVGGGLSVGDSSAATRLFRLGGADSSGGVLHFGSDALTLLRGFPVDSFAGSRVGLVNVDYRWPILRIERGAGTWPLFLHTVHAAVGGDVGHAWTGRFRASDAKSSIAAELSLDLVAGYRYPLTVTAGGALGHDGEDGASATTQRTVYVRIGSAF
jgi:hypothetical protein